MTLKNHTRGQHRKYLPYVFTERGVAMLSAVLHSDKAIIDNKELYYCGASLKDLGKKCFAITKMEDVGYIEKLEKIALIRKQKIKNNSWKVGA